MKAKAKPNAEVTVDMLDEAARQEWTDIEETAKRLSRQQERKRARDLEKRKNARTARSNDTFVDASLSDDGFDLVWNMVDKAFPHLLPVQMLMWAHPGPRSKLLWHQIVFGMLATYARGVRCYFREVEKTFLGLSASQRRAIGLDHLPTDDTIGHQFKNALTHIAMEREPQGDPALSALGLGCELVDRYESTFMTYINELLAVSTDECATASVQAIDGTHFPVWSRKHYVAKDKSKSKRKAAIDRYGTGPNTVTGPEEAPEFIAIAENDLHARTGHKPAKNGEKSGFYLGHELHIAAAAADRKEADIYHPLLITAISMVPAGTNRAHATKPMLEWMKQKHPAIDHILADRGYSQHTDWAPQVMDGGYDHTIDLKENQRSVITHESGALIIDGGLYSPSLPPMLRNLESHTAGDPQVVRTYKASLFEQRRPYAYERCGIKPATKSSPERWVFEAPCSTKRVYCTMKPESRQASVPVTVKTSKGGRPKNEQKVAFGPFSATTTGLERSTTMLPCCAQKTITVDAAVFNGIAQKHPYGTFAWVEQYYQRNRVESVNSFVQQNYGSLENRGFLRFVDPAKYSALTGDAVTDWRRRNRVTARHLSAMCIGLFFVFYNLRQVRQTLGRAAFRVRPIRDLKALVGAEWESLRI